MVTSTANGDVNSQWYHHTQVYHWVPNWVSSFQCHGNPWVNRNNHLTMVLTIIGWPFTSVICQNHPEFKIHMIVVVPRKRKKKKHLKIVLADLRCENNAKIYRIEGYGPMGYFGSDIEWFDTTYSLCDRN